MGVHHTNDSLENTFTKKVVNLESVYFGKHVPAKMYMFYWKLRGRKVFG